MSTLYLVADVLVFVIGVWLVVKHYQNGLSNPKVLSGIAFVLIGLPTVLSVLGVA